MKGRRVRFVTGRAERKPKRYRPRVWCPKHKRHFTDVCRYCTNED